MATFSDNAGREWNVRIDAPSIMRIREDCDSQFLLNDGENQNTFQRLQSDPVLLCRIVFLLCRKQRKERDVSEEDFYLSVIGDAIDSATEALLRAIVNFTPKRTRELLEAVSSKNEQIQKKAIALALKKINDPELEKQMMASMEEVLEKSAQRILTRQGNATSTPGSSVSSQAG